MSATPSLAVANTVKPSRSAQLIVCFTMSSLQQLSKLQSCPVLPAKFLGAQQVPSSFSCLFVPFRLLTLSIPVVQSMLGKRVCVERDASHGAALKWLLYFACKNHVMTMIWLAVKSENRALPVAHPLEQADNIDLVRKRESKVTNSAGSESNGHLKMSGRPNRRTAEGKLGGKRRSRSRGAQE